MIYLPPLQLILSQLIEVSAQKTHRLSKGALKIKCISEAMNYLCSLSSSSRETPWPLFWDITAQHCSSQLR